MKESEDRLDKGNREIYIDCIRIIACLEVVILHCIAGAFEGGRLFSGSWYAVSIIDAITHTGVPLFFMISGAIFLNRDVPVSRMYSKYILRIMVCFLVWSVVYAAYSGELTFSRIVSGHFHMWYLYAIVGLYMIVPLLKAIVEKHGNYFLILSFTFAVFVPTLIMTFRYLGFPFAEGITEVLDKTDLCLPMGYSFYFVAGCILSKADKKHDRLLYLSIVPGMLLTVLMTYEASLYAGRADSSYYEPMTLNIVMTSCGMFVLLKRAFSQIKNESAGKVISHISGSTLGIYLVHILVRDILTGFMGDKCIGVLWFFVFVISYVIVQVFKHIPGLRRLV